MNLPNITIQQLLEAGVHFGHHKRRWNPKMEQYIFGIRNNIHIFDLRITLPLLYKALESLYTISSKSGKILFVGTKKQASNLVEETAKSTDQYFITKRWFGGTLTNWNTISNSIKRLENLELKVEKEEKKLSKKELLTLSRQIDKLNNSLGGIRSMTSIPNLMIILDTVKDKIAVQEAKKLNIPILGIVDTNSEPDLIDYPIPGNDDAIRSIELYLEIFKDTIIEARKNIKTNNDVGDSLDPPKEQNLNKKTTKEKKFNKKFTKEVNESKKDQKKYDSKKSDSKK